MGATGDVGSKEREEQPMPWTMCQGKRGQIIARNGQGDGESVSMFDITQIPFRVVVPHMQLGMQAVYLSYCELPGVGGALAVTDRFKLCMFSLDSRALLWSVESWDEKGQRVNLAGPWSPYGVCSDNRGRLYVADCHMGNNRVIVLSAASGLVQQVVRGRGHLGVTVYGPDIKYVDDDPTKAVFSGTALQEFKDHSLEEPEYICWHEQGQSVIVYHKTGGIPNYKQHITYFHVKF